MGVEHNSCLTYVKVIAEFGRVTNVSANNFFLKLDALTPQLLAFFRDKSGTNKQVKQEMDTFSHTVGITVQMLLDCISCQVLLVDCAMSVFSFGIAVCVVVILYLALAVD